MCSAFLGEPSKACFAFKSMTRALQGSRRRNLRSGARLLGLLGWWLSRLARETHGPTTIPQNPLPAYAEKSFAKMQSPVKRPGSIVAPAVRRSLRPHPGLPARPRTIATHFAIPLTGSSNPYHAPVLNTPHCCACAGRPSLNHRRSPGASAHPGRDAALTHPKAAFAACRCSRAAAAAAAAGRRLPWCAGAEQAPSFLNRRRRLNITDGPRFREPLDVLLIPDSL